MAGDASASGRATSTAKREPSWLRGVPSEVRLCALAGLLLSLVYAAVFLVLHLAGSPDAGRMLRLYVLTFAVGREAALFDALHHGMSLPRAIALSILDDIGTLLLALVVAWWLHQGLRRVTFLDRFLLRLETRALRRRAWIRKWGLAGLALFFFLPGLGSGVLAACMLGVVARIPLGRIAWVLSACAAVVDAAWAVALVYPARALPAGFLPDWLPLAVVAFLVVVAALEIWRDATRGDPILLELSLVPSRAQAEAMRAWGMRALDDLVEVDLSRLAAVLGRPVAWKGLVPAAELLVLDGADPPAAQALVAGGARGLRSLAAMGEPGLRRLREAGLPDGRVAAWHEQARAAARAARRRAPPPQAAHRR